MAKYSRFQPVVARRQTSESGQSQTVQIRCRPKGNPGLRIQRANNEEGNVHTYWFAIFTASPTPPEVGLEWCPEDRGMQLRFTINVFEVRRLNAVGLYPNWESPLESLPAECKLLVDPLLKSDDSALYGLMDWFQENQDVFFPPFVPQLLSILGWR